MTDPRDIAFNETQHAWRNRFIVTIIACETLILSMILGGFALKYTGQQRTEIIIAWVVCVIIMPGLILSFRQRTKVVGTTLRVWFPPFPGWKIDMSRIRCAEQRKLSPMGDLGGWGYKITRKHGHAMNTHGDQFVIITLDNDKKRTIGTQRPEELLAAIRVLAELPPDESELESIEG
ncbi:MAG: hypothetical protein JJ916_09325 [Phycisphaerales bacterium]|nr:hypothetical protein [Phycisphaerales bacterium]